MGTQGIGSGASQRPGGEEQESPGEPEAFLDGLEKAILDRLQEMYNDGTLHLDEGNGLTRQEEGFIERMTEQKHWLQIIAAEPAEVDATEVEDPNDDMNLREAGSDQERNAHQQ